MPPDKLIMTSSQVGRGTETDTIRPPRPRNPCHACDVREMSVCGSLEPAELDRLSAIASKVTVDARQTIIYEGEGADNVFNLTLGTVRLSKMLPDGRRQITGFLFPGDFLGLVFNETYGYTAEAVTAVSLCRFPRWKFEALLSKFPHLEKRLLSIASNELMAAQDQMLLLGRKSSQEKVASFLLMLSRRAARHGLPDNPIDLPMNRADIADYLGLTTETVSRALKHLHKNGLLTLPSPSQVALLQPDALEELTGDDLP